MFEFQLKKKTTEYDLLLFGRVIGTCLLVNNLAEL